MAGKGCTVIMALTIIPRIPQNAVITSVDKFGTRGFIYPGFVVDKIVVHDLVVYDAHDASGVIRKLKCSE